MNYGRANYKVYNIVSLDNIKVSSLTSWHLSQVVKYTSLNVTVHMSIAHVLCPKTDTALLSDKDSIVKSLYVQYSVEADITLLRTYMYT